MGQGRDEGKQGRGWAAAHPPPPPPLVLPSAAPAAGLQPVLLRLPAPARLQREAGGLDLLLARHEDEDVPRWVAQVHRHRLLHCSFHIVLLHAGRGYRCAKCTR